jgi:hypothetical protein
MRMTKWAAVALVAAIPVVAGAQQLGSGNIIHLPMTVATNVPLVVRDAGSVALFELGQHGCLRGPLKIRDQNGEVKFSLKAGVLYPAGCDKQ